MSDGVSPHAADETERFVALARSRLRPDPPRPGDKRADLRGDHSLDPGARLLAGGRPMRAAAVLVPVLPRADGLAILLTQRASHMRQHSGQIAFPGGKMDGGDPTPLATALREADEEIGLPARAVTPLGYLDPYLSGTNFFVIPVVGLVSPPDRLRLNPDEVDNAFEVPLAFLMDEANHELHAREFGGGIRTYYAMPFGPRYIWGVTAGILRNMFEKLYGP